MDDRQDPSALFFGDEDVDLYSVLNLESSAKLDDIKKSYRKLALVYHPDKHATAEESRKADAALKFQQISFAYTVLGDEKRRERYDKTGKTDEGLDLEPGEDGWEAYFDELFDSVTKEKLDEMKKEYQGSDEEVQDLKKAYLDTEGSIDEIMNYIPHSTHDDESRFIVQIASLIKEGELPALPAWESSIKDEKAKLVRKKQADKEAKEAEALARELGVWDEFYGSGKAGPRKGKRKGTNKGKEPEGEGDGEDEDYSALQALILKKKGNAHSFLDGLAAKYAEPKPRGKGKRKAKVPDDEAEDGDAEPPRKKRRGAPAMPDIDDAEFEKLQQKLFADKDKAKPSSAASPSTSKGKKGGRSKKGKS